MTEYLFSIIEVCRDADKTELAIWCSVGVGVFWVGVFMIRSILS